MALVKRVSSSYTIESINGDDVTITAGQVTINGNLVVSGNSSTASDLAISDNLIVLNTGEVGAGITIGTAGIEIDRGLSANVSLLYNETSDVWTLTNDGSTFETILVSDTGLTDVSQDASPELGGDLDTLSQTISSSTGNMNLAGNVALAYSPSPGVAVASTVVLYADTPGEGESGLYVSNSVSTEQELLTKRKAIMLSIIF